MDAQDALGETPLHKAARSGRLTACQLLIENGADRTVQNGKGQTALDLARAGPDNNEVADYLASAPEVPQDRGRMRGIPSARPSA